MATHASILAWEIPWIEKTSGLQSMGSQKSQKGLATKQQKGLKIYSSRPKKAAYTEAN